MKTKSVFALLLTLLLCFGAELTKAPFQLCICPSEVVTSESTQSKILNVLKDLCSDCGHTTNCCFTHTDVPFISSITISQLNAPTTFALITTDNFVCSFARSSTLAQSGINKAPPRTTTQTLVSLHQQLLI